MATWTEIKTTRMTNSDLNPYLTELEGHKIANVYQKRGLGDELELVYIKKPDTFTLIDVMGGRYIEDLEGMNKLLKTDLKRLDWLTWHVPNTFRYDHGPLSNFWVERDGLTLEHRFQALKTNDLAQKLKILRCSTPGEAKKRGKNRALCYLRPDWDEVKRDLMWDLLIKKFLGNPFAASYLLATGEALIQEKNTWNDRIWGVNLQNQGQNLLGMGLMYVRDVLND